LIRNTQLPWSTANEDLVELFETTGQVELAEILFDGTRSKGAGVVQFGQVTEAETAIGTSQLRSFCVVITGECSQVPTVHVWWATA
jgi:RNA recognition motif. (a.k.a. RRM, RBD, or RNP domain)